MGEQNAKLVNAAIGFFILIYCIMLVKGKIPMKKRSGWVERNKNTILIVFYIALLFSTYEVLSYLFKWK